MGLTRRHHILLSVILASVVSGIVYSWDVQNSLDDRSKYALGWARHIASQAETLTLYAQEKREPDPIAWAVRTLGIGMDPRPIQISVLRGYGVHSQHDAEQITVDPKEGILHYFKTLSRENSDGVQIQVYLGYVGFMGTRSRWMNDFSMLLFTLLLSVLMWVTIKRLMEGTSEKPQDSDGKNPPDFFKQRIQSVLKWANELKSVLIRLGLEVKNVVRSARGLISATVQSHELIQVLAQSCLSLKRMVSQLEKALLEQKVNPEPLPEPLKEILDHMKELVEDSAELANSAVQSQDEILRKTSEMNESITRTTQTLSQGAKVLQELKEKTPSPAPTIPPSSTNGGKPSGAED